MDSKILKDFLAEQKKLMNAKSHITPAHSSIIRPENHIAIVKIDTPEDMYNHILEKKPGHKKVVKFLQECIDSIVEDED